MTRLFIAFGILILLIGCASKKSFIHLPVKEPFDVIIVPGYPHYGKQWEDVMKIRVYWSKYLYEKGYANNIIYSGSAVYSKYIESKTMALYAKELGIDSSHIFIENEAEHSTENVYYSYLIAKKLGYTRIALASDPFQSKNLAPFIKKYCLPIEIIPISFDTMKLLDKPEPYINLEAAIQQGFVSLKEREGFFKRLGGTFGKHIIWHEEDLIKKRQIKKMKRKGRLISKIMNQ